MDQTTGPIIIVTVKQVPDTHNVTENAMRPDGTVNRGALPTIFNPEDLNALETALSIKDQHGGKVICLSMGPAKALEILKECLYRGADETILLTDRKFAGADTLATSYALHMAIKKIGKFDLVISGRQAIDGDTAQVGPQLSHKLGINLISNVEAILEFKNRESIVVKRGTDFGHEVLKAKLPLLLTVSNKANTPRFSSAKRIMMYKNIDRLKKEESYDETYLTGQNPKRKLLDSFKEWNAESIHADPVQCGPKGSPTKVKNIENVVLTTKDSKSYGSNQAEIENLVRELMSEHII